MFFFPKNISVKLRHVLCRWVFRMHQMLLWSQGFWASDLYRSPAGCWAVPTEVCCGVWSSLLLLELPSVSFPMSLEHFHLTLLQIPSTRTLAVDINDSPAADQHPDGCPGPWPHWTCLTLTTHQRRGGQTFFWKGLESEYSRHVGHTDCHHHSALPLLCKHSHRRYRKAWSWPRSSKASWIWNTEFHLISICHEIVLFLFWFFPQPS